nr:SIR2 family protein [Bradyrhizobium sp. 145]
MTEIGIRTPVPDLIKERRNGRSFLFFGCRFNDRLSAIYARQITKRSADVHRSASTLTERTLLSGRANT